MCCYNSWCWTPTPLCCCSSKVKNTSSETTSMRWCRFLWIATTRQPSRRWCRSTVGRNSLNKRLAAGKAKHTAMHHHCSRSCRTSSKERRGKQRWQTQWSHLRILLEFSAWKTTEKGWTMEKGWTTGWVLNHGKEWTMELWMNHRMRDEP